MTINLTINDIPEYLKSSKLYETLNENDSNDSFDISKEFFKKELVINTLNDLIFYIRIFDYWMINNIPNEFYDWVFKNKDKIDMDLLNDQFPMNDLIKQIKIIINTPINKLCTYYSTIGDLELLKHAHENRYPWDEETCLCAAENGHLGCLIYAHKNGCYWIVEFICIAAAHYGHLECLKYAHKNGCKRYTENICRIAALYGHLDCLKYAHENGFPWDILTYNSAVVNGDLECLKYVHENGCRWLIEDPCRIAAQFGHLDCLKYVYENGCTWDKFTSSYTVTYGHLDCLKYAHENGCPWDVWTCRSAAEYGYLECLKYAHENGCPWDENTCHVAARKGHLDCLKYAHENGCPWLVEYTYRNVLGNGQLECLKYARENGCKWLVEEICQCTEENGDL